MDSSETVNVRMEKSISEILHWKEYNYVLINQNVKKTVNDIMQIIKFNMTLANNEKLVSRKIKTLINF